MRMLKFFFFIAFVPVVFSERLSTKIKPIHYELYLHPRVPEKTFTGNLTLTSQTEPEYSASTYILNADSSLVISSVTGSGVTTFNQTENEVVIQGTDFTTISFEFSGTLDQPSTGWFWINDKLAVTEFEPSSARLAFPCFDDPNVKATFNVTIESNLTALFNMPVETTTPMANGWKKYKFQETHPISTYLLAWVVGELDSVSNLTSRGTEVSVYAEPDKVGYLDFALQETILALEYFESFFQVNYSLPVLQSVSVPGFIYLAKENWGLVVYDDTYMLAKENNSIEYKMVISMVIFHEIAHMWCGDLATPNWWSNLWLAEGFATYHAYTGVDATHPEWDFISSWQTDVRYLATSFDQSVNTHPINTSYNSEEEILDAFDPITYEKAGSVIQTLVNYIGENDFKNALEQFYTDYANKSVSTELFANTVGNVSGKPVENWLNPWINKPNYPLIYVNGKTLTQSAFVVKPGNDGGGGTNYQPWKIPVSMSNHADFNFDTVTMTVDDAPDWFVLNSGSQSFHRTLYNETSLAAILTHLSEVPRTARAILLEDYYNLALAGLVDWTVVVDLLEKLSADTDQLVGRTVFFVYFRLAGMFGGLGSFWDFGTRLFERILTNVGVTPTAGEPPYSTVLRYYVKLNTALYMGNQQFIDEALDNFEQFIEKHTVPVGMEPSDILLMLRCGVMLTEEGFDVVKSLVSPAVDPELHKYAALSLGFVGDSETDMGRVWAAFESATTVLDKFLIVQGISESPMCQPDTIWNYFKAHFDAINAEFGSLLFMGNMVPTMLGMLGTEEELQAADVFLKDPQHKIVAVELDVLQAFEQVRMRIEAWDTAGAAVDERIKEIIKVPDDGNNTGNGNNAAVVVRNSPLMIIVLMGLFIFLTLFV